jgi:hypothetical protein
VKSEKCKNFFLIFHFSLFTFHFPPSASQLNQPYFQLFFHASRAAGQFRLSGKTKIAQAAAMLLVADKENSAGFTEIKRHILHPPYRFVFVKKESGVIRSEYYSGVGKRLLILKTRLKNQQVQNIFTLFQKVSQENREKKAETCA